MERTAKDFAEGSKENDNKNDDNEDDVQVTINMDSISTQMTSQVHTRGKALVNLNVAKRISGIASKICRHSWAYPSSFNYIIQFASDCVFVF